ncbi:uncharacterized protein LOC143206997 [Lasioglossum baleicum]|uniref:uncharacterized protein LOC143206997 n=1 Tax=Lasioglossum baleicum TaxID=434251 RepID=UPI003FCE2C70
MARDSLDRQVKRKNARKVGRMRCAERPLLEKENPTRVDRCERHATHHTHILCVNLLPSPFSYSFLRYSLRSCLCLSVSSSRVWRARASAMNPLYYGVRYRELCVKKEVNARGEREYWKWDGNWMTAWQQPPSHVSDSDSLSSVTCPALFPCNNDLLIRSPCDFDHESSNSR